MAKEDDLVGIDDVRHGQEDIQSTLKSERPSA